MFDLGATELLVIGIVAIIVVGPKELPKMLRAFGQFVAKMRGMAREFQSMFEEAARETGVDDMAKSVGDAKNFSVSDTMGDALDPLTREADELRAELRADIPDEPRAPASRDGAGKDPVEAGNRAAAKAAGKRAAKSGRKPGKKSPPRRKKARAAG